MKTHAMSWLRFWCWISGCWLLSLTPLPAQDFGDEIVLKAPSGGGQLVLPCDVLDYTGRKVVVRMGKSRKEMSYPASDVLEVRGAPSPELTEGQRALSAGEILKAEAALTKALAQEPRVWMRREILALLVRTSLQQQDFALAGQRFLKIVATDPDTRHVLAAPLHWTEDSLAPETIELAKTWLSDPQENAKLLAASWLLLEPKSTGAAEAALKQMVRQPGERVRSMAQWQLWRLRIFRDQSDVSNPEIQRWKAAIKELPSPARTGPYYLLGRAHWQRNEFDLAAAAFLRVPFGSPTNNPVAAQATYEAALALRRSGLHDEAISLLREVTDRYQQAPAALAAKRAMQQP